MDQSKLLTVAIPTWNGARHLPECLRSIKAQHDAEYDLLVSDDRSEDDTLDVVRQEAGDRARIVVNTERLGLAGNWNQCVAQSRTPWVAIFHQDDVMRPGHLGAHLAGILATESLGMVASAADVIDEESRPVPATVVAPGGAGRANHIFATGKFLAELAAQNPIRCSGVTIRAEAHAKLGGFDPRYRYVVDWDFWIRLARDWAVAWLARPTVAIRWHGGSETQRLHRAGAADLEEVLRLLEQFYATQTESLPEAPQLRRTAERHLARAFLSRAQQAWIRGEPALGRHCLRQAVRLWPGIFGKIAVDPVLAAQLAMLMVVPERWTRRRRKPNIEAQQS